MAYNYSQKKSSQKPYRFNFAPAFIAGDNIASVVITCAAGVSEISAHRLMTGQDVYCRFNTTGATAGLIYAISVRATTTAGDIETLDLNLTVLDG